MNKLEETKSFKFDQQSLLPKSTSLGIIVPRRRSSRAAAHGPSPTKPTSLTSHNKHTRVPTSRHTTNTPACHTRHHLAIALAHACSSTECCSPLPRRPHLRPSRTRTRDSTVQPQWTLTSARSEHLRRRLHMSPSLPRELLVPPAGSWPRRGCRSPCCPGLVGRMGRGRGRRGQHSPNSQRTASPMTTWASTSPLFVLSVISFFSI